LIYLANLPHWWVVIAFALFRLFDVWKPFPIGFADRKVHGGFGIMLDDLLAGLMAMFSLAVILYIVLT
jgi:phosphatidylglycerophosphatase A